MSSRAVQRRRLEFISVIPLITTPQYIENSRHARVSQMAFIGLYLIVPNMMKLGVWCLCLRWELSALELLYLHLYLYPYQSIRTSRGCRVALRTMRHAMPLTGYEGIAFGQKSDGVGLGTQELLQCCRHPLALCTVCI